MPSFVSSQNSKTLMKMRRSYDYDDNPRSKIPVPVEIESRINLINQETLSQVRSRHHLLPFPSFPFPWTRRSEAASCGIVSFPFLFEPFPVWQGGREEGQGWWMTPYRREELQRRDKWQHDLHAMKWMEWGRPRRARLICVKHKSRRSWILGVEAMREKGELERTGKESEDVRHWHSSCLFWFLPDLS